MYNPFFPLNVHHSTGDDLVCRITRLYYLNYTFECQERLFVCYTIIPPIQFSAYISCIQYWRHLSIVCCFDPWTWTSFVNWRSTLHLACLFLFILIVLICFLVCYFCESIMFARTNRVHRCVRINVCLWVYMYLVFFCLALCVDKSLSKLCCFSIWINSSVK